MFSLMSKRQGPEQPLFWLGLCGFSLEQRAALEAGLARSPRLPRWRLGELADADAWWVNGDNATVLPSGEVAVQPGMPGEPLFKLSLTDTPRHVAFAAMRQPRGGERAFMFDPSSPAGMQAALLQADAAMRLARAKFVLGSQLLERGGELRHGIFHLSLDGRLVAVLDLVRGHAGLCPDAHPVDIAEAQWSKRPPGAGDPPESFACFTIAEIAWAYLRRSERDLLPTRYRMATIYFRKPPRVPLRILRDSQLILLRELAAEPADMRTLSRRTGITGTQLAHDLSCLYHAGAITTTPSKAEGPVGSRIDSEAFSRPAPLSSLLDPFEEDALRDDLTVRAIRMQPSQGKAYPTPSQVVQHV